MCISTATGFETLTEKQGKHLQATNPLVKFCGIFKILSPENNHCLQRFANGMQHATGLKVTSKSISKELVRVAQGYYFSLMT